jgi:hypothetical protein
MNANDYAQLSTQLRQLATSVKSSDTDPFAQSLKLIEFHLNSAAAKALQIAESMAAAKTEAGGAS